MDSQKEYAECRESWKDHDVHKKGNRLKVIGTNVKRDQNGDNIIFQNGCKFRNYGPMGIVDRTFP